MIKRTDLSILGLSKMQERVLSIVVKGPTTPLEIARATRISRPTVYDALHNLKKRGLVRTRRSKCKTQWEIAHTQHIEKALFSVKNFSLGASLGVKEVSAQDTHVIIHHGTTATKRIWRHVFIKKKYKKIRGLQGDAFDTGWLKLFTKEELNESNRAMKANGTISETIYPEKWIEKHAAQLGSEWLMHQQGRLRRGNIIHPRYFNHGGCFTITEESVCLFALNEKIVIEIKNKEIRKMLISLFEYVQDNAPSIDCNTLYYDLFMKALNKGKVDTQK